MKPAFIGIGAQKCASTWLHGILAEHPEVSVAQRKELDFFSCHYDRGYEWYERHFPSCARGSIVGETSPSYFCGSDVPERIHRYVPDVRILVSFRDPVERALSNHRHEVRQGHFTGGGLSFEAGLGNNPMYLEQGRYARHLKRWLKIFPQEQILVVLMDDVRSDPLAVASKVYQFLDIDAAYIPRAVEKHFNKSFANRSHGLAKGKDALYQLTRSHGMGWVWDVASAFGLKALYRKFNVVPSELVIPEPRSQTLAQLRAELAPEIAELATLIQRPLEAWLK